MNLSKSFSRRSILTLWLATLGLAWISASQTWFTVEMFPDGKTVELQQFDGGTTYPFLMAIFIASAASLFASLFVQSLARKIVGAIAGLISVGAIWLIATKVAGQDLSGISKQLETLTGIAANHHEINAVAAPVDLARAAHLGDDVAAPWCNRSFFGRRIELAEASAKD